MSHTTTETTTSTRTSTTTTALPVRSVVVFNLLMENMDYNRLAADSSLLRHLARSTKAALARALGHGLTADDLSVLFSEGSVLARIVVVPPEGSAESLLWSLGSASAVGLAVQAAVRADRIFSDVATGAVDVTPVGRPGLAEEATHTESAEAGGNPNMNLIVLDGMVVVALLLLLLIPGTKCWLGRGESHSMRSLLAEHALLPPSRVAATNKGCRYRDAPLRTLDGGGSPPRDGDRPLADSDAEARRESSRTSSFTALASVREEFEGSEAGSSEATLELTADVRAQEAVFVLDNSQLRATTAGVQHRRSKRLQDAVAERTRWGDKVLGMDCGDGWVRIAPSGHFLPIFVDKVRVLVRLDDEVEREDTFEEEPTLELTDDIRATSADYVLDNARLKATTTGIGHRRSKSEDDYCEGGTKWGEVVRGVDCGDGWLMLWGSGKYLPMFVNEHPILIRQGNGGGVGPLE